MEGTLSEFDLAAVLQVVGLGRQYTGIEVHRSDGRAGTIYVKSGVVVSVHSPPDEGKKAFFQLFGDNKGHFHVFRMDTPKALPTPLGAMQKLLMEAMSASPMPEDSGPTITVSGERADRSSVLPFAEMEVVTSAALAAMAPEARPPQELTLSSIPPRNGSQPEAVPPLGSPPPPQVTPPPAVRAVANNTPPAAPPPKPAHAAQAAEARPAARSQASVRPVASGPRPASVPPRAAGGEHQKGQIIAVVSPKGGSGKTTIALNTAIALARQGHRIVLVDADINGDVLSSINARSRAEVGTYDILSGHAEVERGLLPTIVPNFRIMPAVGARLPSPEVIASDLTGRVRWLLQILSRDAHVIVDTPAGMFGFTRQVLLASTHVVAVLQAELVAHRSFERFREALSGIPDRERPAVLGVVLNMLQMRHGGSLSVLQNVCTDLPQEWLFETSIPRHNAIIDATAQGVPIRHLDERSPPAVAFLFDTLAGEIAQRLRLGTPDFRPLPLLL
jgi:cellulose biosynthesis protein BcsQ